MSPFPFIGVMWTSATASPKIQDRALFLHVAMRSVVRPPSKATSVSDRSEPHKPPTSAASHRFLKVGLRSDDDIGGERPVRSRAWPSGLPWEPPYATAVRRVSLMAQTPHAEDSKSARSKHRQLGHGNVTGT